MTLPDPQTAYQMLSEAPGPSPWWCRDPISTTFGPLYWEAIKKPSGFNVLRDSNEEPRLVLPMYTWFRPLEQGWLLLWWTRRDAPLAAPTTIVVELLNIDRLRRLTDLDQWLERTPPPSNPYFSVASEFYITAEIRTAYAAGRHELLLPPGFDRVSEFFVVARNPVLPRKPDGATYCIYAIDPAAHTIEVVPQDWFNDGTHDYGYEWITCATRDPATRRLLVSGFRIDSLVLDETGRQIAQTLPPK